MSQAESDEAANASAGSAGEVFLAFLKLGLTSFGGPIAHLGYFRDELVLRRKWIDEAGYADLVALCQFLPGPASSQVGFAMGLLRGGALGAAAAWTAFTLPSAIALVVFAFGAGALSGPVGTGIIAGLKIVAVAIVAQAVWGMARALCPDRERATIALGAVLVVIFAGGALGQIGAILLGAFAGLVLIDPPEKPLEDVVHFPVSKTAGAICLAAFAALLAGLPLLAASGQAVAVFDAFYRAGALVFGGGHVVLPLLDATTVQPGWVGADQFLTGYGAAQAVPGPLFTFAAYLGAVLEPAPNGVAGALIALVAIFLPGFLLLVGMLPFWNALRTRPQARALMAGTNAAVVGILGAALYTPVFTSAVTAPADFALALTCFVLLTAWKSPPWVVVIVAALGGAAMGWFGI
ncbi:chromate efflux transporter [Pelagibacterium xiamenense]|uniref:chromate efflux transporter n=1 Tax=Pelagibacterium xiamenense TaxID=2901140 RepID=UPI001E5C87AB|nr:chromate efflux transporter [Pelagibacterium xiamenense]MCD7061233.1 chromate efflux transporter [Pelagibacterium xiamenense]